MEPTTGVVGFTYMSEIPRRLIRFPGTATGHVSGDQSWFKSQLMSPLKAKQVVVLISAQVA